jgi:predicted  nucleic acid-binding Zn-ribbon protein
MSEVTIRNLVPGIPEVYKAELIKLVRVEDDPDKRDDPDRRREDDPDKRRLAQLTQVVKEGLKEVLQAVGTTTQALTPLCNALTTAINNQAGKPIEICMSSDCVKALTQAACEAVLIGNKQIDEISAKLDGLCKFREETESKEMKLQTSLNDLCESQGAIQVQVSDMQVKLANMERRWFDTDTELRQCREKISRCEDHLTAARGWAEREPERFAGYSAKLANELDMRFSDLSARFSGAIDDLAAVRINVTTLHDDINRCCNEAKEEIRRCAELVTSSKTEWSADKADFFKTTSHLGEQIAEVALRLDDLDRHRSTTKSPGKSS